MHAFLTELAKTTTGYFWQLAVFHLVQKSNFIIASDDNETEMRKHYLAG
jgi:hypothetical protein